MRTRNWILAVVTVGILGGAGVAGLEMKHGDSGGFRPLADFRESASTTEASPAPTDPGPTELATRRQAAPATRARTRLGTRQSATLGIRQRARNASALNAALKKYARTVPDFSVAVLDRKTGQRYSYRGTRTYETASVVKVQVLTCLLLTAQDHHRHLSSTELALARRMIRLSDNDATTSLFNRLGRNSGVQACDRRLGLTETKVDPAWGLTRTTTDDQVKLLSQLVSGKGPLNGYSRELAYSLMSTVDRSQDWGVPAAARPGEKFTVKNGWLPRSTEGNRWIINSVGRITGPHIDVSIAVLSHGHRTMSGGIAVVQKVAKLTRQYLRY